MSPRIVVPVTDLDRSKGPTPCPGFDLGNNERRLGFLISNGILTHFVPHWSLRSRGFTSPTREQRVVVGGDRGPMGVEALRNKRG